MKVLIVDDEPNILMSLEFLMRKARYEVLVARNGKEAMQAVEEHQPDIVLLDIMMPDVDGFEVCRFIKSNPSYAKAKVIFLSAKSKESDIAHGYELGAELYITKPFSTRSLMKKVQELANA